MNPIDIDENIFFRQVTLRICGSLDIEKAMLRCLQYLSGFLPLSSMLLALYEPSQNCVHCVSEVTFDDKKMMKPTTPVAENIQSTVLYRWETRREGITIVNRPEDEPFLMTLFNLKGKPDLSMMGMPLSIEENKLGLLGLIVKGRDRYTDSHSDLLSLLHEPFAIAMSNVLRYQEVLRLKDNVMDDNQYLRRELLNISGDKIIGERGGLKGVMEMVNQVSPLDSPVLLLGETGVGKEIIANAIHYNSHRKDGPFIKVNCGAIPENLVDSELFGHEKGAFTGAISQSRGRFERAHTGTIFLDEIGDLPLPAQVKLLRVIQNREIERVGGTAPIAIDIRIISATHRNLEEMVSLKEFREDLWFRLNIFPITIPPLRARSEDITELAEYLVEKKSKALKLPFLPKVSSNELGKLKSYHWPGNVREFENIVERSLIQSRGKNKSLPLSFDLPALKNHRPDKNPTTILNEPEHHLPTLDGLNTSYIEQILNKTNGKIHGPGGAAEILGINGNTLRTRMVKLGIPFRQRNRKE